jgi:GntP family gluconate:H+ symporter
VSHAVVLVFVVLSIGLMILLSTKFKCNMFLSMFVVSLALGLAALPSDGVVAVMKEGFGGTLKSIGLIIVLGIMIGLLLERSGATLSMALAILRLTGERRADWAIGVTGLIVGIPIFCDSGFVVLSGLNRSLVRRTGKPMAYMATLLAIGLYSVHCLIPPHPGALAAAGLMRTNIGFLIGAGLLLAAPGAAVGFAWARWVSRRTRNEAEAAETTEDDNAVAADGRARPPTVLSFLPIVIPVALLTVRSVLSLVPQTAAGRVVGVLSFLGQPEVALLIGVGLAAALCRWGEKGALSELFDQAIDKTGPILVLTGAGGVFGAVIKATGVGEYAGGLLAQSGLGLCIPFVMAAFLKTALGSSTVAVMTAASIIAPMLGALRLESETARLLATLAMGAGSMIASHTNDSYFWVVTRFSGLAPAQTLRIFTTATVVVGAAVFLCVWLCSLAML